MLVGALLLAAGAVNGCVPFPMPGQSAARYLPREFSSAGEQIYFTGVGSNGNPIPFQGGPMWLQMHGGGCASCHGANGKGGYPLMMSNVQAPDIRYHALTEEQHEEEEAHLPYTDELIKRAITQGIDPAGKPLDWTMPRWAMSPADLDYLIQFLRTLDGEER